MICRKTITSWVSETSEQSGYTAGMNQHNPPDSPFGSTLRRWRQKRRFSQMALGLSANVSARHISFLETGRAKPSREMVLQLADSLAMPKPEANRALHLAGFAPAYPTRSAKDQDLAPIHRAIAHLLDNHMPYPAIALDRVWNMQAANAAAVTLLQDAGFAAHSNLLEALIAQPPALSKIVNWDEAIGLLLSRLHTEAQDTPMLEDLVQRLSCHYAAHAKGHSLDRSKAVIPTQFDIGGQVISVFSTIASFGSVQDIVLDDLKIELMFPMDAASEAYFRAML